MSLELIFKKNDLTTIVFLYLIQNKSLLEVAHSSTGVYENSEMLCDGCKKYTLKISNEKICLRKIGDQLKRTMLATIFYYYCTKYIKIMCVEKKPL